MHRRGKLKYLPVEIAVARIFGRLSWRMRHYLDTEEAVAFVSGKVEELAAVVDISKHARKFAASEHELNAWFEVLDRKCEEISKTLSAVAELAEKDDLVLAALSPRGRQALKTQLASAAVQLQQARDLRDRSV